MELTTRAAKAALVIFALWILAACSHKALSTFFDVPPPSEETGAPESPNGVAEQTPSQQVLAAQNLPEERPPLPIEKTLDWSEALELLPKDFMSQPDWAAAEREGVIQPLPLPGTANGREPFGLDFFLRGANPMFDAWFPHSAHTTQIACGSCHGKLFRYRDNDMTMAEINQGEYCGACHGKVAFPSTSCKRCHTSM